MVDHLIFFLVIPSLELVSGIKPIRNVMAFAVDHRHIVRPVPSMDSPMPFLPIDFCLVKRTGIALYSLRESLKYIKVGRSAFPFRPLKVLPDPRKYHCKAGRSLPVVLGYVYASPIASSTLWSLSMLLQRRRFSPSLKYQ